MIDTILRKQLGVFVVVYLDDILIYSNTLEEHKQHVHEVLQTLQDNKLLVEATKCQFHQHTVHFLGYVLTHGEIRMSPEKIKAIKEWPTPTNLKDVRAFTAFVNFYRKFLSGYGDISRPLTNLTKKDVGFKWTDPEAEAFQKIKDLVTKEPVMKAPDPEKPYELETDASDYALGGQLGQRDDEGRLHPVAFFSKKLHGPELNYGIHDKELMAIIKWYETLTDYDFEIIYRKGSENGRADALSRREDLKSEEQVDNAPLLRQTKDGNLVLGTREINATWQVKPDDTWMRKIASHIKKDSYLDNWETKPHLFKEGGTFLFNERQYVPSALQEQLVREIHEHPLHGHQGVGKTISRLRRSYDFPESRKRVQQVVDKCDVCRKAKAARHAPYGELQPIPPPERAWQTVTMDFIVKLPKSKEPMTGAVYDSILVIVDKLTKYAYYIPYMESSDAKDLAYMFFKTVVAQHGLPTKLISDRDKLFTSNF
ncbi:hypothetical protein MY5147_009988 [Beauveria neobassiana]